MDELKSALEAFFKIGGVNRVLLTNAQGEVLESSGEENANFVSPGILAVDITELCAGLGGKFNVNEITQSHIEFDDMNFISIPIKGNYFLSIISSKDVNVGRIRLEVKKAKKTIESVIS